jgi:hypothetical protein
MATRRFRGHGGGGEGQAREAAWLELAAEEGGEGKKTPAEGALGFRRNSAATREVVELRRNPSMSR